MGCEIDGTSHLRQKNDLIVHGEMLLFAVHFGEGSLGVGALEDGNVEHVHFVLSISHIDRDSFCICG